MNSTVEATGRGEGTKGGTAFFSPLGGGSGGAVPGHVRRGLGGKKAEKGMSFEGGVGDH